MPIINILKLEESINKTASLLLNAKTILKDFEYLHLFKNNYENLLTIDFINENELTNDLDQILKYSKVIDTSIISILKKYCKTGDKSENSWFEDRLTNLRNNINSCLKIKEIIPKITFSFLFKSLFNFN